MLTGAAGPRAAPGARELRLPGEARAFVQSTIYAKLSGYVKSIRVDKGDAVRKGQLLGEIESPETDQQVAAAEASVLLDRRSVPPLPGVTLSHHPTGFNPQPDRM